MTAFVSGASCVKEEGSHGSEAANCHWWHPRKDTEKTKYQKLLIVQTCLDSLYRGRKVCIGTTVNISALMKKMFSSCLNFLKRSTLGKCTFFSLWAWKQHINHIRTSSSVGHGPQIIVIFSRSRNASWTTNQCFLSPRWLKHVANFISHYFFLFFQFPSTISDVVFMKESRSSLTKNRPQNVSLLWNGHLKM